MTDLLDEHRCIPCGKQHPARCCKGCTCEIQHVGARRYITTMLNQYRAQIEALGLDGNVWMEILYKQRAVRIEATRQHGVPLELLFETVLAVEHMAADLVAETAEDA